MERDPLHGDRNAESREGIRSVVPPRHGGHRELGRADLLLAREQHGALDHVAELPNVSGPVIPGDLPLPALREMHGSPQLAGDTLHEEAREENRIPFASAEGRDLQGHHVEPVVEVLAEATLLYLGDQLAIGRGEDPDVHRNVARPAHPTHDLRVEELEELRLEGQGKLADLIQEDRAALGRFEESDTGRRRVREGSPLVPEELALQELARNRGAVHLHERTLLPRALAMNGPREELLPDSGFPEDQDRRGAGLRDAAGKVHRLLQGDALPDDALESELLFDARVLPLLARLLGDGAPGGAQEPVELREVDRLEEDVPDAQLQRLGGLVGIPVREDHHLDLGPVVPQPTDGLALLLEHLGDRAGKPRCCGPEVEKHQLARVVSEAREVLLPGIGDAGQAFAPGQVLHQRVALPTRRHDHRHVQIHTMEFPPNALRDRWIEAVPSPRKGLSAELAGMVSVKWDRGQNRGFRLQYIF